MGSTVSEATAGALVIAKKPIQAQPVLQSYELARSIIRYGSFTPSERLILLSMGLMRRLSGTVAGIREIAGTTREYTVRILHQLVKRGIVDRRILRFPPTGVAMEIYKILYQPSREPLKALHADPDAVLDQTEVIWTMCSCVSYAEGFVELADPVAS